MEFELVNLNSELWEIYGGAYGNVREEVAILMGGPITERQEKLRRLDLEEKGDYRIAFDNLCENLFHQMSFYKATYLALPYLVRLLERDSKDRDFGWKLTMISEMGICLATDIPGNHRESAIDKNVLNSYEASLLTFQELTKQFLEHHEDEIRKLDFYKRSMLITAVLAIFGERETAFILTMSGWDTFYMLCDSCEYCEEELAFSEETAREVIVPVEIVTDGWDGSFYEDGWLWISNMLSRLGAQEELEILSYYYGTYTCPECGAEKKVLDFMKCYLFEG